MPNFKKPHFQNSLELIREFEKKKLPKNFCIVPFTNMILNPGGNISICRQKGTEHVIGSLKTSSLEELWNSSYLQKWRTEFLTGKVEICRQQIETDACNLCFENYDFFNDVNLNVIQDFPSVKITCNLNGHCNLRCKMCSVWKMENGFYKKTDFFKNAQDRVFPFLKEVELLSGEPFIQDDTYHLIDAVSSVNHDCQWSFTTNGNWQLSNKIKSKLDSIKIKNIIFSIDSLDPDLYREIRIGGDLNIALKNIDLLTKYVGLTIHYLVMKDNYKELPDFVKFCNDRSIKLTVNLLQYPEEFSLLDMSNSKKMEVLDFILGQNNETVKGSIRISMPLIKTLPSFDRVEYTDRLKKYC